MEVLEMKITNTKNNRILYSKNYNYIFNKKTGFHARWGKTADDDPDWSPYGPEIADIEISTVCSQGCKACYKSNVSKGKNMSLETFKKVFEKLPEALTQIAFGIGDIDANPDLYRIFKHCRENDVVPNITINGSRLTPYHIEQLASLCGAVATSRYDPDTCYDAIQALTEAGLAQCNIHQIIAEETLEACFQVVEDAATDPRLKDLGAIVFLALKPVGRGKNMTPMRSAERYRELVDRALELEVGIGFDSCSAALFLKAMEGHRNYKQYQVLAEPCESSCFSVYVDVEGKMHPCSFLENDFEGIDVVNCNSFIDDVWNNKRVVKWRENLLTTKEGGLVEGCRQCPAFDIY